MAERDETGLGDKVTGIAKEAAGKALSDDELEQAGEQQQKKAQSAEEAERLEEEAERKRAQQAGHAGAQRRNES